jgi:hypothetical protein
MKHGLAFLMVKSKTLLDDPKIGQKMVKENTTSFSKLFGDTLAKGMVKVRWLGICVQYQTRCNARCDVKWIRDKYRVRNRGVYRFIHARMTHGNPRGHNSNAAIRKKTEVGVKNTIPSFTRAFCPRSF